MPVTRLRETMAVHVATFGELFDAHQAEILRYLVRLTGNRDTADDLFQETFLRAFRAFGRLRRHSNPRAWVYRIATNTYLNHRRGVRRRGETALRDDVQLGPSGAKRAHAGPAGADACDAEAVAPSTSSIRAATPRGTVICRDRPGPRMFGDDGPGARLSSCHAYSAGASRPS